MMVRSVRGVGVAGLALLLWAAPIAGQGDPKPALTLKASPQVGFPPMRVVITAELKDVGEREAEFYCPSVEWDWGDDTKSTQSADCAPFEAGSTPVKTRFVQEHTYNTPGRVRVVLRLARGSKTLVSGSTSLTVRPGGNLMY